MLDSLPSAIKTEKYAVFISLVHKHVAHRYLQTFKKLLLKKKPRLWYRCVNLRIQNIKLWNKFLIVVNILSQLVELINLIYNSLL